MELDLYLVDDSGLIGLVDADAYVTFVEEDWEYEQLMDHFASQMQRGAILVWNCEDGGNDYRVRVRDQITSQLGFREATGQFLVTGDRLHLASYTALTLAAQFPEYRIPGKHEEDQAIAVAAGRYRVRIVQMYDPKSAAEPTDGIHFLLEIEPGEAPEWKEVVWRTA